MPPPADHQPLIRASLGVSFFFNLAAAAAFAFPSSPAGALLALPVGAGAVYPAITGYLVALFGVMYGWLAVRPHIDRSLLALGAIGKAGVFVLASALWLNGAAATLLAIAAAGDLCLAALWSWWLISQPEETRR